MSLSISSTAFPPPIVASTQSRPSRGSALLEGVQTFAPDTLANLIDQGEDLSATDSYGNTLLHLALKRTDGCAHLVILDLLRGGMDVNAKNQAGNTPLRRAMEIRDWDSVLALLQHPEIDVCQVNHRGNTALHLFSGRNSSNQYVLARIINQGLNIDPVNNMGKSPLHCAVECADIEWAKCLIEAGANSNLPDHNGITPFQMMVDRCQTSLVQFALKNGANPNLPYPDQTYPIQHALRALKSSRGRFTPYPTKSRIPSSPHAQIAWDLVQANADLTVRDAKGNTPLHLCGQASKGKGYIWHLMKSKGADPHARNHAGKPPIFGYDHQGMNALICALGITSIFVLPIPFCLGAIGIKGVQIASEQMGRGSKAAEHLSGQMFKFWSASKAP